MLPLSVTLLWNRLKFSAVEACNCLISRPGDPFLGTVFIDAC